MVYNLKWTEGEKVTYLDIVFFVLAFFFYIFPLVGGMCQVFKMQEGDKTLKSVALVILIYPLFAYTQNFRFLHGTDGGKFALREGERERGREGERELQFKIGLDPYCIRIRNAEWESGEGSSGKTSPPSICLRGGGWWEGKVVRINGPSKSLSVRIREIGNFEKAYLFA